MGKFSIIIRTRNEEQWIGHCLSMVCSQDVRDFEIILVDNNSTDHTVEVAKRFALAKVIIIDEFFPGEALNRGIRACDGDFIVCLSAHCIPKRTDWLSKLYSNFRQEPMVAGVYGRQLPVSFTDPVDKRDLLTVFGEDRRVQIKDYFFHNANSMVRRDVWEKYPFDEEVTNIEDRVWGKAVIAAGYRIVYEPEAPVYHHHGLHQGNNPDRAKGVVSVIEAVDKWIVNGLPDGLKPGNVNVAAVLPILGKVKDNSLEKRLVVSALSCLSRSRFVNNIYVVSSQSDLVSYNATWIDRCRIKDVDELSLDELMKMALNCIESKGDYPGRLLYVNYDYFWRPEGLFDELIYAAQYKGYDTVFSGYVDYGHYWFRSEDEEFRQTDSSLESRDKRKPVFRALYGLGCLTSTAHIRRGKMVGGKTGILPIKSLKYTLRKRDLSSEEELLKLLDKNMVI